MDLLHALVDVWDLLNKIQDIGIAFMVLCQSCLCSTG